MFISYQAGTDLIGRSATAAGDETHFLLLMELTVGTDKTCPVPDSDGLVLHRPGTQLPYLSLNVIQIDELVFASVNDKNKKKRIITSSFIRAT